MFAFTLRKTGSMHEQPGDLWWKSVITFIRKGSCVYAISVPLGFSFFLVLRSICAPTFHPHIKAIHHRDQNHCVSPRQPDLLVGSFCVCEFYDWGQGPGTHRYISDKVSLWLPPSLPLSVRSLFAQLDQRELQGRMLMSLLKKTIEFQHTLQPASCCRAPAQENTTLFIPEPPSKSVKLRVLLIKTGLFCFLCYYKANSL